MDAIALRVENCSPLRPEFTEGWASCDEDGTLVTLTGFVNGEKVAHVFPMPDRLAAPANRLAAAIKNGIHEFRERCIVVARIQIDAGIDQVIKESAQ